MLKQNNPENNYFRNNNETTAEQTNNTTQRQIPDGQWEYLIKNVHKLMNNDSPL